MNYHKKTITLGERKSALFTMRERLPGDALPGETHHHTSVEISCVLKGSGTCTCADRSRQFSAGDILMFAPGEGHCIESDAALLLTLSFEPRLIWTSGADFPDSTLLQIFFDKNDRFDNLIPKDHTAAEGIKALILNAEAELTEKGKEYALAAKVDVIQILLILLKNFDYAKKIGHASSRSYNLESLEKAMEYIANEPEKVSDLDLLAEKAQLSRSHFCTVFKRYNGISPWDYITIKRIEKALDLLKAADITRREIAAECGFNNSANFYRAFKKITGKAPGDYAPD